MSANPIGAVILAVAALAAGVVLLYKNFDTVKEVVGKVGEFVANIFSQMIDKLASIGTAALEFGKTLFTTLTWPYRKAWEFITGLFDVEALGKKIIGGLTSIVTKIPGMSFLLSKLPGMGGGKGNAEAAAPQNDFVMRPGQKAVPFSSQDTIMGFKGAGPGGGSDMAPVVASVNLLKEEMIQLRKDMSGYFGVGGTTVKGIGQSVVSNIEAVQGA